MKQLKHVTTFSLIIALTGLSSVMAAEAGRASDDERIQPDQRPGDSPLSYHLTLEQMDGINAGGRSLQPKPANTVGIEPGFVNSGRSGQPDVVNTSGRSGQPGLVNTIGRSGQYGSVNTSSRSGQYQSINSSSRSGQYEGVNTGRR